MSAPTGEVIRVGLVGTFARWKGHETFLRSIQALHRNGRNDGLRFYIVGGPVYATAGSQYQMKDLREKASALGVAEMVGFTGFVNDVASAMRALDIVVHASTKPEPFGLVIAQAMACGRAVISTATGGARELIEPERDALNFPTSDTIALAAAIDRLAQNPTLRRELGTAGRAKVTERFSQRRMVDSLMGVYESVRPR